MRKLVSQTFLAIASRKDWLSNHPGSNASSWLSEKGEMVKGELALLSTCAVEAKIVTMKGRGRSEEKNRQVKDTSPGKVRKEAE